MQYNLDHIWNEGMKSGNEHFIYFFHLFLCLDKFNINMNEIKNDFDGNEISLISEISIDFQVEVF